MRVPPHRVLQISRHPHGEDVRRLQVAINDRDRTGNVTVDGEYGVETEKAAGATALALGVSPKTLRRGLTRGAQRVIRSPKTRSPAQFARAAALKRARAKEAARRPLRLKAFDVAKDYLEHGVREVGGNNVGPIVSAIIRAMGGTPGEPWCGDFVGLCYRKAGSKMVHRMWASTVWLLAKLVPVTSPLQGHIVVYDFGTPGAKHTGFFDEWIVPGQTFWAIEGNTAEQGAVSDSSGGVDGVHRRQRSVSQVAGWRRVSA